MRSVAVSAFSLGLFALLAGTCAPARAEYYCSVGFTPTYGGRCVATASRDEIELYLNDATLLSDGPVARHRHHRRHGLRARY